MGETQNVFTTSDLELGLPSKESSFKHFPQKGLGALESPFLDGSEPHSPQSEPKTRPGLVSLKDNKEPHSQREAVIRPQQAGKIDFKSLHNRPKVLLGDSPWDGLKGSPPSPHNGKGRARDKSRRLGKGHDRGGHQQLYRLTISSARPNPTIGIAYPQQKVTPPKKVEVAQGGPYRFYLNEREVDLQQQQQQQQQEDPGFARCFPEAASHHLSSYTSPTATPRLSHGAKVQPPLGVPHEAPGANGQLHYLEFQGNGSNWWLSPDKGLPGANANGLCSSFPETSNPSGLGSLSFHYPSQSPGTDPFQGEGPAAVYRDLVLTNGQGSHGAFPFHPSSWDWQGEEGVLSSNGALESRDCGLPPSPAPLFLPPQTQGPLVAFKGRKDHPTDSPNGAISLSGAMDSNSSTFQENPSLLLHKHSSLHVSSRSMPMVKRHPLSKDPVAGQRLLDSGHAQRRTLPTVTLPQMHFQSKAYSDPPASGLSPSSKVLEKTLPTGVQAHGQLLQPWEGSKRLPHASVEQGHTAYLSPLAHPLLLGGPSGQHLKKAWPHLHLGPTQTGQSRAEQSKKQAGQKSSFPLGMPEWDGKMPKSATDYPSSGKGPPVGEGAIMQRQGSAPLHCSSSGSFCFEGGAKKAQPHTSGVLRSKSLFFGLSPARLPNSSRLPGLPALVLPPPALASSPSESPVPSPALHTPNSSTCSSLSSTSSSPSGFEDGATPTFFHPPCHSRGGQPPFHGTELLSSGAVSGPVADLPKALHLSQEPPKQDLLYKTFPVEGHLQTPCLETSKGYLESFEVEPPPPPYSSHHFLATSLSNTSLDQLDVFLTCKQCDHNFSTLSSFLEHRQFCSSHLALLAQARDLAEGRKQPPSRPESAKHVLDRPGLLLPPEPHLQLMEEDGREEPKDDPLRTHPLNGMATNPLQLSASDLEIDDAKLDSLITETLNGLEYQSDNPEIDSSFIDVFADEELSSVKLANNGKPYKSKENLPSGKKAKHADLEEDVKTLSSFDDPLGGDLPKGRTLGHHHRQKEKEVIWPPLHGVESLEIRSSQEIPQGKRVDPDGQEMEANGQQKGGRRRNSSRSLPHRRQAAKAMSDDASPPGSKLHSPKPTTTTGQTKGTKKPRRLRSSTWSKELIHKIVQQKNKLHKLHAKGSQAKALPLPASHLVSAGKEDSRFGEYEYISESDDERVEYAKRHCPRKVGSRLHGRVRSGFSRRHQGRRGKEKEKEPPAWRLGPRRSMEEEAVQRALNKEPGKMEGVVGKAWRRGSRSSTSRSQSSSFSSENNSSSSPNAERADSETERETESRERFLLSPTRAQVLARERRVVAEKERAGRHHEHPHETRHVAPTHAQPTGVKASQRENPSALSNAGECLLQAEEKPLHHKGPLDHSPSVLFGPKDPEEGGESPSHNGCKSRARLPGRRPSMQGGSCDACHCPAYQEETTKCHKEEPNGPPFFSTRSCPNHGNASYGEVDVNGLKKPAEFMASIGCISNSSVDDGMVGKGLTVTSEATGPFPDCKGLTSRCEPLSLFSGATATEASVSASFYLCQGEMEVSLFKQKTHHIMPFRVYSEVDHLSPPPPPPLPPPPPPLNFDSSSVFGELSEDAFDGSLYESVALSKESCVPPFECASPHPLSKMIPYDQQYTSFLHGKGWELLEDVSPVLTEAISQFHHLPEDNLEPKRYLDALDPVPLPSRVVDYSVPFLSSMSEDELEIKRLVTELENQLQTGKLNMEEAPEEHSSPPKPHQGRKEDPPLFLPLTLVQESDGKGLFLAEPQFEMQDLLPSKTSSCENLESEKIPSEVKYGSPQDPWPGSGPFKPLEPALQMPSASELVLDPSFSPKGDEGKLYDHLNDMELSGKIHFRGIRDEPTRIMAEPCLSNINVGVPSYAEDLMQSPEFLKSLEVHELHGSRALPTRADACLGRPPKEKKTLDSARDLELYSHSLKAEFGHEEADSPESEGNLPPGSHESPVSPEEKVFPRSRSPEMPDRATSLRDAPGLLEEKESGSPMMSQSPTGTGDTLHSKAWVTGGEAAEHPPAPGGKAANPLEELQMFVARTAKHNEEELLLPCFPVVHRTAVAQPEQEKGPAGVFLPGQEVDLSPAGETRRASLATEEPKSAIQGMGPFLEPEKQAEHTRERDSPSGTAQMNPEHHDTMAEGQHQRQHRRDEGSKESVVNQLQDGISPECSRLPTCCNSRATTSPREEGSPIDQVMGELMEGQEKAALALESGMKCPLSHGSLEKEPRGTALTATSHVCIQCHGSWGGAGPEGQALVEEEAQPRDRNGDQVGQLEHNLTLPPCLPPLKDGYLPQGPEFSLGTGPILTEDHGLEEMEGRGREEEASSESFPVHIGFAEQKHTLDDAPGTKTSSGFGGGPAAVELPYLTGAESPQGPLLVCRDSPETVENATQYPSKDSEDQGGLPPTSPLLQCCGAPLSLLAQEMAQNSTGPQKTSSTFGATSLCSGDPTTPLLETGQIVEVQRENHHSSSMSPLENEAVSDLEELPKLLDYEERSTSGERDTVTSPQSTMQNILLGQSPSEADSALLTEGRAAKNVDFSPKEEQTSLQDGNIYQRTQPETLRKEVGVPVMSRVSLVETANAGGMHPNTDQLPEVSANSLRDALQEIDSEDKTLEQKENLEGLPSCLELEESKGKSLRDASKAWQLKAKKRKGLQAVCDICFFSFKSKIGLTRHKTVKHLKKNQDSLLWEPDFAPPEKAFKANKPLSKKNRKSFVTEEASSSRVSKVADDHSFPKSYRGQRQEPSREIQEFVSKMLGDLNDVSSAISHKLDLPSKKVKTKPTRSWVGRPDELASRSPKEATMGGQGRETNVNELDGFSGKKPRGRVRKGKGISNPTEAPKYSLEMGIHAIHSEVPPDSLDHILTTTTKGQETSSTCSPEGQASEQPSPWPPCSLRTKVPQAASGRRSSTEEAFGQDAENGQEQAREPPLKETWPSHEGWPSSSVEGTEEVMMCAREEEDDNISQKGLKSKESALENWKSTEQKSQLDFTSLQASHHDQRGSLEAASDKAMDDAFSYPVETKSCRMDELPPKTEPHRDSTIPTPTPMAPDLQSVCDDDATFSQLFPRNDPLARRKCTRVYGKRTKKPKPVSEVKLRPQGIPDPLTVRMASDLGDTSSFCTTREDLCEYDTISIDDTLMLSMYHGSNLGMGEVSSVSLEHMALREDGPDLKRGSPLSFLGKKKISTGSLLCLSSWSSPEQKADDISVDEAQLSPSQELMTGFSTAKTSPEPPDLEGEGEGEDTFEPRTNEDPPSPAFHTIDMEMLDAKVGVKDVCLYGVKEDHRDDRTLDLQPPPILQGRPAKSKLEEGKAGKARGDLTLKAKDKQYKCKVCFQWFLTLGELDFHKLSHNPSPPPTCYMCVQRKFSSREQLRDHLKEKHAKNKAGLWACGMCLKEISEVWMYNEHLREHATQFARKGQAQKSVLGMPGCFGGGGGEEDAAVTRFLNSLMCQKPCKASRREEVGSRASTCKESKGHQEGVAGQESPEVSLRVKPTTSASPKMPVAPSTLEPAPKAEGAQKVIPMHRDCKDPSRDCHHCGKQFPKPFKLQRHLVVHSLQKIYLCHRCPRLYQETQELRCHLSQEHQAAEEAEVKHTTLYACELCADVMHVIKKSFICSTCNYTFSKKEQYDRHMEKHLVGSSRTFRFRGVVRPGGAVGKKDRNRKVKEEARPGEDVPMAKKKKVYHHHHQQGVSITLGSPAHLDGLLDPQPHHGLPSPPPAASHRTSIPPSQSTMKTEIQGSDFSSLLAKTPNSPPASPPPPPVPLMPRCESSGPEARRTAVLSSGLLASEGALPAENLPPFLDPPESGSNIDHTCSTGGEMDSGPKLPSTHPPEKHHKEPPGKLPFTGKADPDVGPWVRLYLEKDPLRRMAALSKARAEAAEGEAVGSTSPSPDEVEIQGPHCAHLPLPDAAFPASLPLKDQTSSPALNRMAKEIPFKRSTGGHALAKSDHHNPCSLDNVEDMPNPLSSKDKAHPVLLCGTNVTTQEPEGHQTKPLRGPLRSDVGAGPVKHNSSDPSKCQGRRTAGALAKLHPKKWKEHKSSHKGNSASRENIEGDRGRKKNAQTQDLMRKESARGHRRTNWTNSDGLALSPRKKDSQCNKLTPKLKASVASGQVRKATLDPCFPRKVEGHPSGNGNLKRKKEVLISKSFRPLSAKDPSLPGSFNRTQRALQGAKLAGHHNYRTAESQNNLLSQLFGQKLTSFKIPLRRETSE